MSDPSSFILPHPKLMPIDGTPNNRSIKLLKKQLYANACVVHLTTSNATAPHWPHRGTPIQKSKIYGYESTECNYSVWMPMTTIRTKSLTPLPFILPSPCSKKNNSSSRIATRGAIWTKLNARSPCSRSILEKANKGCLRKLTADRAGYHGAANAAMATPPPISNATRNGCVLVNGRCHMYYCWTHGLGKSCSHISATCTDPAEGHINDATANNMKGGNNCIMTGRCMQIGN